MPAFPLTNSQPHSMTNPSLALFPNSDKASPLDIRFRSIGLDQRTCSLLSFALTLGVRVCVYRYSLLSTPPRLPFLRNWLSSLRQVCLILSCLTSCYLESHLPEPLNPLVTHDNKKLGRLLLEWRQGGGALVESMAELDWKLVCRCGGTGAWLQLREFRTHGKFEHSSKCTKKRRP